MNQPDDHTHFQDDLAAYLLDALTGDEARAFERHLDGCPRCQERSRWLQGSVDLLPATVEQVEPPQALRERLMRTVYDEAAPAPAPAPAPRRRRAWRELLAIPRPVIAMAAAVVVAAAIGGNALGSDGDGQETVTARAEAPAGVTATVERTGDEGILRVSGLTQRTDGIYEVWIARDGNVEASTLFQVHRNGSGAAAIPRGLDDADQVMVTFEPRTGSVKPTRAPIIVAKV